MERRIALSAPLPQTLIPGARRAAGRLLTRGIQIRLTKPFQGRQRPFRSGLKHFADNRNRGCLEVEQIIKAMAVHRNARKRPCGLPNIKPRWRRGSIFWHDAGSGDHNRFRTGNCGRAHDPLRHGNGAEVCPRRLSMSTTAGPDSSGLWFNWIRRSRDDHKRTNGKVRIEPRQLGSGRHHHVSSASAGGHWYALPVFPGHDPAAFLAVAREVDCGRQEKK